MSNYENDQAIVDIIIENQTKDDNEILGLIIGAGVPFNKAKKVLDTVLVANGLKMTKEQRDDKAEELLSGWEASEDTTAEEVSEQVDMLMDELNTSIGIARSYIKALFMEADIPMPKASKAGVKRGPREPGFNGDAKITTEFLIANPDCTEEEFVAFMVEKGIDKSKKGADKTKRWWGFMQDLKIFGNKWCDADNC